MAALGRVKLRAVMALLGACFLVFWMTTMLTVLTVACCTITRVHAGARYDLYVLTMSITACTVLTVSERLRKAGHAKQSGVPRSLALPLAHPMLGSVRAGPKQTKAS